MLLVLSLPVSQVNLEYLYSFNCFYVEHSVLYKIRNESCQYDLMTRKQEFHDVVQFSLSYIRKMLRFHMLNLIDYLDGHFPPAYTMEPTEVVTIVKYPARYDWILGRYKQKLQHILCHYARYKLYLKHFQSSCQAGKLP